MAKMTGIYRDGTSLEVGCQCSLIVKTHDLLFGDLRQLTRQNDTNQLLDTVKQFNGDGILIIRNPFDAIVSYRNFVIRKLDGHAPPEAFSHSPNLHPGITITWDHWVLDNILVWETVSTTWIRNMKRGGVVYYENLRDDTESELRRVLKMLSFPLDEERLNCVLQHKDRNAFKRRKNNQTKIENPYSRSQTLLILQSIETVQLALKERNLDPLPVEKYKLYNSMRNFGRL